MNFYKINGQATRWMTEKLSEIGYKNIANFERENGTFIIHLKDGRKFGLSIDPLV